jgi:hypothetical protein
VWENGRYISELGRGYILYSVPVPITPTAF